MLALRIAKRIGLATAHAGYQRIGCAKVNACRQPVLVGSRGHAGFGNLQ
jgi:hypothetical protein